MVVHILKNGSRVSAIKGHVVKKDEIPAVYALIEKMNRRKRK